MVKHWHFQFRLSVKYWIGKKIKIKAIFYFINVLFVLKSPNKTSRFPKCLVLAPTRELCLQIHKSISELAPELRCTAVYGGAGMQNQIRELGTHCDIVCATPGRLKDLMQRQHFVQDHIELVCLDEADHLLRDDFRVCEFWNLIKKKKKLIVHKILLERYWRFYEERQPTEAGFNVQRHVEFKC